MTFVTLVNGQEPYKGRRSGMHIPVSVGQKKLWQTLSKEKCSPSFFKLTNDCRDISPEKRPTAQEIAQQLEDMKEEVMNFTAQ